MTEPFDLATWPLTGLITCVRCGQMLRPRPATASRRFYACDETCDLGIVDAGQLEAVVGAAMLDRVCEQLAGYARRPGRLRQRWRSRAQADPRLLLTAMLAEATILSNAPDALRLDVRWADAGTPAPDTSPEHARRQADVTGSIPWPANATARQPRHQTGSWPQL